MDQVSFSANQFTSVVSPHVEMLDAARGIHVWMFGILVTLKALGNETGGAYSLVEDIVLPGVAAPLHIHTQEDETWYMLDGELEWNVEGHTFHAVKGSFIHLPRFVPHTFWNKSNKQAHMILSFSPPGFEKFFLEAGEPVANRYIPGEPTQETPEYIQRAHALASEKYGIIFPALNSKAEDYRRADMKNCR